MGDFEEKNDIRWWEWIAIGWILPLAAVLGGALGGALGGTAAALNYKLLTEKHTIFLRYIAPQIINAIAVCLYYILAILIKVYIL